MLHCKFSTKSITDFLQKNADAMAGVDIDGAINEALEEISSTVLEDMQEAVKRHKKKGRAVSAIKSSGVQRAGNHHHVEVGAIDIRGADKKGFHVVYQEYGSPGHGTKNGKVGGVFRADPWLRPAMERAKKAMRGIILDVMKKWGAFGDKAA